MRNGKSVGLSAIFYTDVTRMSQSDANTTNTTPTDCKVIKRRQYHRSLNQGSDLNLKLQVRWVPNTQKFKRAANHQIYTRKSVYFTSVIFVNENENGEKRENNEFLNEN